MAVAAAQEQGLSWSYLKQQERLLSLTNARNLPFIKKKGRGGGEGNVTPLPIEKVWLLSA